MANPELISARHIALHLGIELKTVYRYIEAGELGPVVIGTGRGRGRPPMLLKRARVEKFAGRGLPR